MRELTLDDVALRVLQLEPEDHQELARVREQLAVLAQGDRVPIAARPPVAAVMRALQLLADGTAGDPGATLSRVGRLLQRALDVAPPLAAERGAAPARRADRVA